MVAPHAGAWIEIQKNLFLISTVDVAPHAGAWIEIKGFLMQKVELWSPLTQGRGLKSEACKNVVSYLVAPHAGAWIEILS